MTMHPETIKRFDSGRAARIAHARTLRATFAAEVASAGLPTGPASVEEVREADVLALPVAAQRCLRFMGAVGRPRDWSICARWTGGFRRRASERFMDIEAWQYDTRLEVARIFHMRTRLGGLAPVRVRDLYLHGKGHMQARLFDRIVVADGVGVEFNVGELVTYLNDAIMLAPSMLLGPEATFTHVDDGSFDVALTDHGTTVSARVFVDERGAVTDFSTIDRFMADPEGKAPPVRMRWTTPIEGWHMVRGRMLPTRGSAVWHPPSGDLEYAEFLLAGDETEFNVSPERAG
jgi:hypothetical protein